MHGLVLSTALQQPSQQEAPAAMTMQPVRTSLLKRDRPDDATNVAAEFCMPAAEAFTFRLLEGHDRDTLLSEMDAGGMTFSGEFFHQHFGEHEIISGFQGLRVDVWISLRTYHVWIDARWRKRRPGADKVVDILSKHFPHASPSRDAFIDTVVADLQHASDIVAHGRRMGQLHGTPRGDVEFVRYQLTSQDAPSQYVKVWARFQAPPAWVHCMVSGRGVGKPCLACKATCCDPAVAGVFESCIGEPG